MEEAAADYARTVSKPMVAFIAGAAAPPGKKMGHAGAIVTGSAGSYAGKRKALEAAGVVVVDTPAQIAPAVAAGLGAPMKQAAGRGMGDSCVTNQR
jgi:succinyl-CoA synthetase alpha subunit